MSGGSSGTGSGSSGGGSSGTGGGSGSGGSAGAGGSSGTDAGFGEIGGSAQDAGQGSEEAPDGGKDPGGEKQPAGEEDPGGEETPAGSEEAPAGETSPAGESRLRAWEEKAAEAERELFGGDAGPGRDWLVRNRRENDSRIAGILSRMEAGNRCRFYLIGAGYEPESLIFAAWPEVVYSFREMDRFTEEGTIYTVVLADAERAEDEGKEEEPESEKEFWREGDIQERSLGGRLVTFCCIDSQFQAGEKEAALFLCSQVIRSDADSDEFQRRYVTFGEDSNYKTSQVRTWLQKNGTDAEGLAAVPSGVTRAYMGKTEKGTFEEMDLDCLQAVRIGPQVMKDQYFILSAEEAVRYRDWLWKFENDEGPETQISPYSRGYWLRTPVYEEQDGKFLYGTEVYVVDLENGCIRPESAASAEIGIRPAYAVIQGEQRGEG